MNAKVQVVLDEEDIIIRAVEVMANGDRWSDAATVLTACVCSMAMTTDDPHDFLSDFHRIATKGVKDLIEEERGVPFPGWDALESDKFSGSPRMGRRRPPYARVATRNNINRFHRCHHQFQPPAGGRLHQSSLATVLQIRYHLRCCLISETNQKQR